MPLACPLELFGLFLGAIRDELARFWRCGDAGLRGACPCEADFGGTGRFDVKLWGLRCEPEGGGGFG